MRVNDAVAAKAARNLLHRRKREVVVQRDLGGVGQNRPAVVIGAADHVIPIPENAEVLQQPRAIPEPRPGDGPSKCPAQFPRMRTWKSRFGVSGMRFP